MSQQKLALTRLTEPTSRLSCYIGLFKYNDLLDTCIRRQISEDVVFKTKCAFTTSSISLLLGCDQQVGEDVILNLELTLSEQKIYRIYLLGRCSDNMLTSISHAFMIRHNRSWKQLDSYIDSRGITVKKINPAQLMLKLVQLKESWTPEIWEQVTGVKETNELTVRCDVFIRSFTPDLKISNVKSRFLSLIKTAEERLNKNIEDDCVLTVLSPASKVEDARNKLKEYESLVV